MIPEIKKILYATDLSKNSNYAFFYAVDMANRHNAMIFILHAIEPMHLSDFFFSEGSFVNVEDMMKKLKEMDQKPKIERIQEGIKRNLDEFCKKVENQAGLACVDLVSKVLVPIGHPAEEILKAAEDEGCDAIILGTHGEGFLRHTFLGSLAGSVLERTRKPVFIIPLPSEKTTLDLDI